MTVSSANNRDDYTGNGTTANYAYTFRIYAKTDINVYIVNSTTNVETTLVVDTDYRVNNIGATTGTIDLLDAGQAWIDGSSFLDSGYTLAIVRSLPYTQPSEFRNQGTFYPEAHEDAIDRVAMLTQQLNEEDSRTIAFSEATNISSFDTSLPAELATSGAGKLIVVNDAGDGFDVGPTAGNIAAAEANATAAAASAAAASTSETNAAASEASAASAVASSGWTEVSLKTYTNNNTYILNTEMGTCFLVDATSGATNLYLPLIGTIDQDLPHSFMVKRNPIDVSGNAITLTASGVDKINDASTTVVTLPTSGNMAVEFIGNNVYSPDRYQTVVSGDGAWNEQASTKGDIVTYSTGPAKLAVGSDDHVLQADSSASTGLKYGSPIQRYINELGISNYTERSAASAISWESVAADTGSGTFIAVCPNSASGAMRSTDRGETWSGQTIGSKPYVEVYYDATTDLFIALASTGTTAVETSNGSGTWTARTTTSKTWQAITSSASLIVAMNLDGSGGDGAMYSTDAITWTDSTACQDEAWVDVATDGTTFVAVGAGGKISTSTDGDTWTARTSGTTTAFDAIAWNGSIFMALAGTECLTSPDGITWTEVNGSTNFTSINRRLRYCDGVWFSLLANYIVTSIDDGVTWSVKRITTDSMQGICYDRGRMIIVQSSGTNRVKQSLIVTGE